jgi:hypothetical protein
MAKDPNESNCIEEIIPKCLALGASLMARHREYYKGEGGGFPQAWVVVSLVNLCLLMVRPCTKSVATMR